MPSITAVIFDLGRVLVRVDFTRGLMRRFAAQSHYSDEQILEFVFREPLFKDFSKGKLDINQFYESFTARFNLDILFNDFSVIWCDIFAPMEGMEDLVEDIAASHKIGLLSDIDPLHWSYLIQNYVFLKRFSQPVLSYQIGALKPSPKCYRAAAESVDEPPGKCLFIDDRQINILGAKKSGMQAILFKNPASLKQELRQLHIIS